MNEWKWDAPYLDRRAWLLNELEHLNVSAEEALVLLLIDFFNAQRVLISHEQIGNKIQRSNDEVDELFASLSAKGYLHIGYQEGRLIFDISGVFQPENIETSMQSLSLFDEFETEFARPLSSAEMQRLSSWMDQYDPQMILYALYEAGVYEKRSLDYIERILVEWKKRGLTPQDYEEGKR